MSGGPIGSGGKAYFMTIKVEGKLDPKDIQDFKKSVQDLLAKKVNGKDAQAKIASEARAQGNASVTLNVTNNA